MHVTWNIKSAEIGDPYTVMQPQSIPTIDNSMVGKHLDVYKNIILRRDTMS